MIIKVSGDELARQALKALRSAAFTAESGRCEQFAREVFESLYPNAGAITQHFLATARVSMMSFRDSIYNVWDNIGGTPGAAPADGFLLPGDYLYKGLATSGLNGHVGIFFHNAGLHTESVPSVCENSSWHMTAGRVGNVSGAKGTRTLAEFGPFEMVVRLSEVNQ